MFRAPVLATFFTVFLAPFVNAKCSDVVTFEDATLASVTVVFQNSVEQCSLEQTFVLMTNDGIQVKVRLAPNPLAGRTADRLIVNPLTEGFVTRGISEIDVPEGRDGEIIVEIPLS